MVAPGEGWFGRSYPAYFEFPMVQEAELFAQKLTDATWRALARDLRDMHSMLRAS